MCWSLEHVQHLRSLLKSIPSEHNITSVCDWPRFCLAEPFSRVGIALENATVLLPNASFLTMSCFVTIRPAISIVVPFHCAITRNVPVLVVVMLRMAVAYLSRVFFFTRIATGGDIGDKFQLISFTVSSYKFGYSNFKVK